MTAVVKLYVTDEHADRLMSQIQRNIEQCGIRGNADSLNMIYEIEKTQFFKFLFIL